MIKLFVLDLDGCVSEPYVTPDWKALTKIRELNQKSRTEEAIPPVTICTGRPLPYAEAVAQWLDIRLPFVFESAGLFDLENSRVVTGLDGSKEEGIKGIREMKRWIRDEILPEFPKSMLEFTKMMDAGVISPASNEISDIYEKVMEVTRSYYPGLEVHRTEVSVNILIRGNNKYRGVELLGERLDVKFEKMAYIGDSEGDIPALEVISRPYAPSNAIERVKQIAEVIPFRSTRAVLEAYRRIIRKNSQASAGRNGS